MTRGGMLLDKWAEENPERYRVLVMSLGRDPSQVWRWRRKGGIPRADDAMVIERCTGGVVPVEAWAKVVAEVEP
ncbi:MAG: hypothetical protein FJ125_01680 [Deltaproteobacteria bacterium]|nr:hypothetical protein [Deltaproteobacteria bacterium]